MIEGFADTSPPSKAKFSRTLPGSPALEELKFRDMKEVRNISFACISIEIRNHIEVYSTRMLLFANVGCLFLKIQ